jgi:hypothetical protein
MARPTPAPLPTEEGIYWLRAVRIPYSQGHNPPFSWDLPWELGGWFLARVNPTPTYSDGSRREYFIEGTIGSDEIAKWDDDSDGIIVEVGRKIDPPT